MEESYSGSYYPKPLYSSPEIVRILDGNILMVPFTDEIENLDEKLINLTVGDEVSVFLKFYNDLEDFQKRVLLMNLRHDVPTKYKLKNFNKLNVKHKMFLAKIIDQYYQNNLESALIVGFGSVSGTIASQIYFNLEFGNAPLENFDLSLFAGVTIGLIMAARARYFN